MRKLNNATRIDPLSDALSTMQLDSSVLGIFDLAAPWAIRHPRLEGVLCHIVAEGSCYWRGSPVSQDIRLERGDLIVFPYGDAHTLASEPGVEGVPIAPLLCSVGHQLWKPQSQYFEAVRYRNQGKGARAVIIDLVSACPDPHRNPLLRALPQVIHIQAGSVHGLRWSDFLLELVAGDGSAAKPGHSAAIGRVADLIFIQAVRTYLDSHAAEARGLLRGVLHPQISRALHAIHHEPQKDWTVALLATECGMSRTLFAEEFLACLGEAPIHYLTQWRMNIATRLLATGLSVAVVAHRLGYASRISFARTFRRLVGVNPGDYRRGRAEGGAALPPDSEDATGPLQPLGAARP